MDAHIRRWTRDFNSDRELTETAVIFVACLLLLLIGIFTVWFWMSLPLQAIVVFVAFNYFIWTCWGGL